MNRLCLSLNVRSIRIQNLWFIKLYFNMPSKPSKISTWSCLVSIWLSNQNDLEQREKWFTKFVELVHLEKTHFPAIPSYGVWTKQKIDKFHNTKYILWIQWKEKENYSNQYLCRTLYTWYGIFFSLSMFQYGAPSTTANEG